jgi:hypothetical protein
MRLSEIDAFPEEQRDVVRAVSAALGADGGKDEEYFTEIWPAKDGLPRVYLKHESHPDADSYRGDRCRRGREAWYDPKSGTVSRLCRIR